MNQQNKYNFTKRLFSAFFSIPLVLISIYYHVYSYMGLFLLLMLLSLREFYTLMNLKESKLLFQCSGYLLSIIVYILNFLYNYCNTELKIYCWVLFSYACVFISLLYQKNIPKHFHDLAIVLLGVIYIGIPFSLLHQIAFYQGYYESNLTLLTFYLIWATDIGAYLTGKLIGKTPFFQKISPNKTLEGALGGLVFSFILGSFFLSYHPIFPSLKERLYYAFIVSISSIYGDLLISLLKRTAQVKDSGYFLPGHGGVLDRVDSFLLAIPFSVWYLYIFI